jgi:GNAT superfamily N-acetyltransferase
MGVLMIEELKYEDLDIVQRELCYDGSIDIKLHYSLQNKNQESVLIAWLKKDHSNDNDLNQKLKPIGRMLIIWDGEKDLRKVASVIPNADKYAMVPAIMKFWVRPELRSRGYGKIMLNYAESLTRKRGFSQLSLAVYEDNPKARIFYKKNGFVDTELPPFMLDPPYIVDLEDDYDPSKVMRYLVKDLNQ